MNHPDPTLVILGASGDLTRRLLIPALYRLDLCGKLPPLRIAGYALEGWDDARFIAHLRESVERFSDRFEPAAWERFARRLTYRSGDLSPENLRRLGDIVTGSGLFYLALPPSVFGDAGEGLGAAGLADPSRGFRRLIIEKPFGEDTASARALNSRLGRIWKEEQILRIDHFLGKETVQNLLVFRSANRFIEPIWNAAHIESVHITVAETLGLEGRYRYYDKAGALRDMIQNHLMQLFTLTAMEPPSVWDAEVIRNHKAEVLNAVHPIVESDLDRHAARGRYTRGRIRGQEVPGYLEEEGVPPTSTIETFAALKLFVDTWRWKGVPFYLRTGKRLASDWSEIAVKLRDPPARLFHSASLTLGSDWIIFRLKPPDESIDIIAQAKRPGLHLATRAITLHTPYHREGEPWFSAYEQLLLDAVEGDRTQFLRFDEVDLAWQIVAPVLDAWKSGQPSDYPAGSEGPEEQNRLLEPGHAFRAFTLPPSAH